MKALRHPFKSALAVTGSVALVLLAIPVVAVLIVVARGALLLAIPVGLIACGALWVASERFRSWFAAEIDPDRTYKGLRLAVDVAVDPAHAWARSDGTHAVVGADDLMAAALGPVERVELPTPGRRVCYGDVLFRLQRGGRTLDVRAPVTGTVVETNDALDRAPFLVNTDPFRRGWAVKLREGPENWRDEPGLRHGAEAAAWFKTEVDRLLGVVVGDVAAAPAMADGGIVDKELYARIDDRTWPQVAAIFGGPKS